MTREIKFRAWIPEANFMIHDVTVYGHDMIGIDEETVIDAVKKNNLVYDDEQIRTKEDEHLVGYLSGTDWVYFEKGNYELMQFTGLLDKNGKEIYEGDIFKHETQSPFKNDKPFETEIGIVEWGVWSYMYGFVQNKPQYGFDRMKARQVEVIGNIYEHPELLNTHADTKEK